MKKVLGFIFLTFIFAVGVNAQTNDCPPNLPQTVVCVSRPAYVRLLQADDENAGLKETIKARDAQIASRDGLITTLNGELTDFKVKWATAVGENTELRASRVRDHAMMDILIKQARPKKIGLINLF